MELSNAWEKQYASNQHMSVWPWSDLVSYVMRYTDVRKRKLRVLELGCGAGANIPLFDSLKVDYHAIDGSPIIVQALHERFPQYREKIIVGDFTERIDFDGRFDLVIDRGSMICNNMKRIKNALELIWDKLTVRGGQYIGIDWFSVNDDFYKMGNQGEDLYTRLNLPGPFEGLGNIHFSDQAHIEELFAAYEIEMLEEKIVRQSKPNKEQQITWNFIARKI